MTKQELIGKMAEGADITKAKAERALNVLLASVESELVEQGELSRLSILGSGRWSAGMPAKAATPVQGKA